MDKRFSKNGIPHDTLYDIIRLLERVGIIYKNEDDGKYYYIWTRYFQYFENWHEYQIKLKHSENLINEVEKRIKRSPGEAYGTTEIVRERHLSLNNDFVDHLKTGYPKIYELYEDLEEKNRILQEKEEEFINFIKNKIKTSGFEIIDRKEKDRKGVYHGIIELICLYLRDRKLGLCDPVKLFVDEDTIRDERYLALGIAPSSVELKELEDTINSIISDKDVINLYDELKSLESERDGIYYELKKNLERLIDKVKNGTPLKGWCDNCPKIKFKDGVNKE